MSKLSDLCKHSNRMIKIFCFCVAIYSPVTLGSGSNNENLDFKVYLDDKEIGHHHVIINTINKGEKQTREVTINTKFKVKVLFVTAYSYTHQATELWNQGCLESIDTKTTENGEKFYVNAKSNSAALTKDSDSHNGLEIESQNLTLTVNGCVRSFAYWDLDLIKSNHLLNGQTGKHVPVKLSSLGESTVEVAGTTHPAQHYSLSAEGSDIELWYGAQDEWLALQTKVAGGRKLTYKKIAEIQNVEEN